MLTPVKKKRVAEDVVDQIKTLIRDKTLVPGSRLPSERELVAMLNISRVSVREALRNLEIAGLIEVRPGSGAFVRESRGDFDLPLSSWLLAHQETLQEHFEARQVIEPRAAALAAQRGSSKVVKAMRQAMAEFQEKLDSGDLTGLIRADAEFHRLVAEATQNRTLMLLMDTITRSLLEGWKGTLRLPDRSRKTVHEHNAILDAIEHGDPEGASAAMSTHLKNALAELAAAGLKGFGTSEVRNQTTLRKFQRKEVRTIEKTGNQDN